MVLKRFLGYQFEAGHPRILALVSTLILTVIATSASAFEDARYKGRFPAEFYEAGRLRTLAVLPFAGTDGGNFAKALATEMRSAQLNGEPWFTVKSAEGAAAAAGGAAALAAGPVPTNEESADAVRAGAKLDAKAIYFGNVSMAKITRTDRSEQTTECADGADCKTKVPRNIVCTRVTLDYVVNARIVNVATKALVYAKSHVAQDGFDICNGKGMEIAVKDTKGWAVTFAEKLTGTPKKADFVMEFTEDALYQRIRLNISQKIRTDVAPFNKDVIVEFKRRASELAKADQIIFESGVDFSKAGRLDRACSIWEVMESGPAASSISLLYNLGVCQEALVPENPSAALEYYVKADQLLIKPDKLVTEALQRTKKMVDGQRNIGA